jgi:cold shock CspA family protein
MRFHGTLKTWNDERGFGFIQPQPGHDEIFAHI